MKVGDIEGTLDKEKLASWINDRYARHSKDGEFADNDIHRIPLCSYERGDMINYVNDPLEFVYNRGNNNDKEIFNSVLEKIVSERVEKIINEGFDVESADFLQYVAEITWNLHHNKLLNKPELNNLAKLLSKAVRKEFDVDYKKDERKFSHEHDTEFRTATYNAYTYIVRKLSFMDYPFGEDFWNKLLSDKRTLLYASY